MINEFKQIEKLFEELDKNMTEEITIFVIGGAVLLRQGLKPATKDIDLVVQTKKEFTNFQKILLNNNFKTTIPGKEYSNMNLSQIFVREDFRIDLFEKKVCKGFSLTNEMLNRAERIMNLKNLKIAICSNEDILLFKTMTEREGDLTDCIAIAMQKNPDWKIMLEELKNQINNTDQDVWITWVGERLDILEEKGLDIPIMKEINKLRDEYFDKLELKLKEK